MRWNPKGDSPKASKVVWSNMWSTVAFLMRLFNWNISIIFHSFPLLNTWICYSENINIIMFN